MNRIKEIKHLKELTEKYQLDNRNILKKHSLKELTSIYNGIGPEAFPQWLRDCISSLHPTLAPVALIHDVEWHESDGTKETFEKTNSRFKENGYKVAKGEYGWYNPRRWIVMNQARRFGNYCQLLGWNGWIKCYEERLKKNQ